MTLNQHISDYLEYYCSLEEPGFAVLLTGEWGAGKTWFIKNELEYNPHFDSERFLYVSLYGLSSFKEIEKQFFEQLHPFLSSKPAVLAGRVLSGFLKASLKIDINNDGRDDTASLQIPQINLDEFLSDAKGKILIFDDIERCSIEIDKLLGYINYFVEHGGQKVILIANEKEIFTLNKELKAPGNKNPTINKSNYSLIKEKLIGKTLQVVPSVEDAFAHFSQSIKNLDFKSILKSHNQDILKVYYCSNFNNLRALKFSILDFERVFNELDTKFQINKPLILDLLKIHLMFSLEIKCGGLEADGIGQFLSANFEYNWNKRQNKYYSHSGFPHPPKEDVTEPPPVSKYENHIVLFNLGFSKETWMDFYLKGAVKGSVFNQELNQYCEKQTRSDWQKLYDYYDLFEDEFQNLIPIVYEKFTSREYQDLGEILHISGLFLYFCSESLIGQTSDDIYQQSISYLNHLQEQGLLPEDRNVRYTSFYRHVLTHLDSQEMQAILAHLNLLILENENKKLQELSSKFIPQFVSDPTFIYCVLNATNNLFEDWPNLYKVSFLNYIDINSFVDKFIELPLHHHGTFGHSLMQRYDIGPNDHNWEEEYNWLSQLNNLLGEKLPSLKGRLSHIGIHQFIKEDLEPSLAKIRQLQERRTN